MDKEEMKDRTKVFALRVVQLAKGLPPGKPNQIMADQLLRAGTSVGANYRAALRGKSTADFLHKLAIVEEEADECLYWMDLLRETKAVAEKDVTDLVREADELLAIIVTTIKSTRRNRQMDAPKGATAEKNGRRAKRPKAATPSQGEQPRSNGLPYGTEDLDGKMERDAETGKVQCVVRGCKAWLTPPTRKMNTGEACPNHGIYTHGSGTYRYADVKRNLIASGDYFAKHIEGHEFKFESHRLGLERSEDALSWNVFCSFQDAACLSSVAKLLCGEDCPEEPRLFLWGIELNRKTADPWGLLIKAREHFESDLPVERPLTEPDIALHLPGKYLILIEAKFTSPNGYYVAGSRRSAADLTFDELLDIYWDDKSRILNRHQARRAGKVHYQLWRNMIFAEWMAKRDGRTTKAYHINLVREGHEQSAFREFSRLLQPRYSKRFRQATWEQMYALADQRSPRPDRLCRYMETKTERLRKAFRLSGPAAS